MVKRNRGKPVLTLRLSPEIIAGLKISARRHGQTVSDLLREMIAEQLARDGINTSPEPIDGQIRI